MIQLDAADFIERFKQLIDAYLGSSVDFQSFLDAYELVLTEADAAMHQDQLEPFWEIKERSDTTAKHPDAASRQYGWIDEPEFRLWLRDKRAALK